MRENYLAPIENYTNLPFRLLMQKHGAKATIVPLVSATSIARSAQALERLGLELNRAEKFLGIQLVGPSPEDFSIAAKKIFDSHPYIKWFDINAGCPSGKTVGSGCGSALLEKPKKIKEIIRETQKAGLPVSVKMRLADSLEKTLAFAKAVQEADFLIVHGRTRKQGYSGFANWDAIRKVHENSSIPVVGNGDVKTLAQGKELVKKGFCNSFMVGRASLSNPLVFQGKESKTKKEKKKLFLEYTRLCEKYSQVELFDLKLKSFEFFKGLERSARLRDRIARTQSTEALLELINSF